jgi:uncharacterized RDD family membrane protein YckC
LSLPPDLSERFHEEWLSELAHLGSSVAQLAFALRLYLTRRESLIDAASGSDGIADESGAVVSIEGYRIAPDARDFGAAAWSEHVVIMAPMIAVTWAHWTPTVMMPVAFAWNLLWVLLAHVVSVRLWGATPGMLHAGIRIVTRDGSPLEWHHILSRARSAFIGYVLVGPPLMGFVVWENSRGGDGWFMASMLILLISQCLYLMRRRTGVSSSYPGSGTLLVMKIPRVVVRRDQGPPRSTSLMR